MQLNSQRAEWLRMTAGLPYPLYVLFHFIRASHRIFDFSNLSQGVQDAMKVAGYIPDDSMKYLIPFFKEYSVDKKNPGCEINVLPSSFQVWYNEFI